MGSVRSDASREMLCIHPPKGGEEPSAIDCRFGACGPRPTTPRVPSVEQGMDAPHTVLMQPGLSRMHGTEATE